MGFRKLSVACVFLSGLIWAVSVSAQTERPRLLLLISVDQLRYDYLERLRSEFRGGLGRLLREGVSFDNAFHAHAVTTTGPGHASLATGTYPSRSGIVNNQWFDRRSGEVVNCVEDPDAEALDSRQPGRSPRRLLVDTLADWVAAADSESRVFGASRKDRSAVLPAGHRADGAFWYDSDNGQFVTSTHYMDSYPEWMRKFRERRWPDQFFGTAWTPLPVSREVARQARFEELSHGDFADRFPRVLGGLSLAPDGYYYSRFGASPLMDQYLAEFARALIEGEDLGGDGSLDVLTLSFSALDSVGHEFGPNSPEVLDTLLRLDATLGELLEFVDRRVGPGRTVVALSADHGVVPLPEYQARSRLPGTRFRTEDVLCFQRAARALEKRYGQDEWFLRGFYLNYEAIGRRNLLRSEVEAALAASLEQCEAVQQVWTRTRLEDPATDEDSFGRLYRNSFHPERSADLLPQWKEFWLTYSGRGTSHGSPYDYDRHVPLVLSVPGLSPRRIADPVETVDLAPTLASLLGLTPAATLDGRDRSGLLMQP